MGYFKRITIFHIFRFREILHQNHNIFWLQISWDIAPEPKYLMVRDFMRYYPKPQYFMYLGCRFCEILHQNQNISCCIFHEIIHQTQNISRLQISWDITPESQYLMVADFLRYYTRTTRYNISQEFLKVWDIGMILYLQFWYSIWAHPERDWLPHDCEAHCQGLSEI